MTQATLNTNFRMTDAAEREMLNQAMYQRETFRVGASVKSAGRAAKRFAKGFTDFVRDVNVAMSDARARSGQYTGSQW